MYDYVEFGEGRRGVPDDGRIPLRNIRIPDDVWIAAKERAEREDVPLSQVIRQFLRAYADGAKTFKF